MDEEMKLEFKKQHIETYKNAVRENILNNTNVLVDEDIMSLLKKPPLDSMDFIKSKFLDLAKKMGAIIEFNMSSNLALNNINSIEEIPIKSYIDAGVKVVLGTDGHGLYSTTGEQEVILAMAAGLEPEDFEKIKQTN